MANGAEQMCKKSSRADLSSYIIHGFFSSDFENKIRISFLLNSLLYIVHETSFCFRHTNNMLSKIMQHFKDGYDLKYNVSKKCDP